MKAILAVLLPLSLALATSNAEISQDEFDHLFALCQPSEEGADWLEVGWEIDLWKARQRAAKEGKPIFLWEMDGHPLGCT